MLLADVNILQIVVLISNFIILQGITYYLSTDTTYFNFFRT